MQREAALGAVQVGLSQPWARLVDRMAGGLGPSRRDDQPSAACQRGGTVDQLPGLYTDRVQAGQWEPLRGVQHDRVLRIDRHRDHLVTAHDVDRDGVGAPDHVETALLDASPRRFRLESWPRVRDRP